MASRAVCSPPPAIPTAISRRRSRRALLCRLARMSRFHDKLLPRPFPTRLRRRLPEPPFQFGLQQCQLIRREFIHATDTCAWRIFQTLLRVLHHIYPSWQPAPSALALIRGQSDAPLSASVVAPRVAIGISSHWVFRRRFGLSVHARFHIPLSSRLIARGSCVGCVPGPTSWCAASRLRVLGADCYRLIIAVPVMRLWHDCPAR
jgi:hypothetical protein